MFILINGPINSGKTTLSNLLVKKIPDTVQIEVDRVRESVTVEGSDGWRISFRMAVKQSKDQLQDGRNVIFTYHVSVDDLCYLERELQDIKTTIYVFTLIPPKEDLLKDRGDRPMTDYLVKKLHQTYDMEQYLKVPGEHIDNANQTPEETADQIINFINAAETQFGDVSKQ